MENNLEQINILKLKIEEFGKNKDKNIIDDIEIEELLDELDDGSTQINKIKYRYEYFKNLKQLFFKSNNTALNNNQYLDKNMKNLELLKQASRQLIEIEEIGKDTLAELVSQREKIQKQKNKMNDVNNNIKVSNSLLNKMKSWFR